ncbi:MAG: YraN family protein [Parcubacteria group bacterium]|nr:YraN family protein [Parcubacteria group bacterium]
MSTKDIGNLGEKIAEKYLKSKGFEILTGQFYAGKLGEIDIVAEKDKCIHFVEVKTRTNRVFGLPEDAINYHKQQKIKKAVSYFLQKYKIAHDNFQVDCVAIELDYKTKKAKVRYLEYII